MEQEAPKASPSPVVVTLDAEVLVVGSRSFLTQLGAFAGRLDGRAQLPASLLPQVQSLLLRQCPRHGLLLKTMVF